MTWNIITWNIIIMVIGAFFLGYGIYSMIAKKYKKSLEEKYTKESLQKSTFIDGIFDAVTGTAIIFAGLGFQENVLPLGFYYAGIIVAIIAIFTDTFLETKFLVSIKKEEVKEEVKDEKKD